jgi:NADH-quinone oxidoreductase subunit F
VSTSLDFARGLAPEDLLARLEASGLRGRGGGWFPAARKWRSVRAEGGARVVIANGAEGEPGSVKDRHLLRTRASDVLAGLGLAGRAVGAAEAVVFLKKAFVREADAVREAVAAAPPKGLAVRIAHGDDSYIVGEETALLEVLEGRRAWPRPKPPLPAAVGLEGRPTLIHNVETLARLPAALSDPEGYRRTETTCVSLWGDVPRPGLYEVRMGTPLGRVIAERGGGDPAAVACVFPGGPSSPPLGAGRLDTALDPDALRAAASSLGTGALLVVSRDRPPFDLAASLAAFFERESCGQCPPCVRGTMSLHKIARTLRQGQARARDVSDVAEVSGFMAMHGYCAHCRAAAASVGGLLTIHADAVARAVGGSDPGPKMGSLYDPFAPGSPQRTAIEAWLA